MTQETVIPEVLVRHASAYRQLFKAQIDELEKQDLDPDEKDRKIKKLVANAIHQALYDSFIEAHDKHLGKYIGLKDILNCFPKTPEQVIRSHLTKLRRRFLLEKGLLLANAPKVGYRLGIAEDISLETTKACFRGWGDLCATIFMANHTQAQHKDLSLDSHELLAYSRQAARSALAPLRTMEERLATNESMKKVHKQTSELRAYIESLASQGEPNEL